MKCKYCGSNLSIEDEKCSFCGRPNPFVKKHQSEMRHFTKEFSDTKKSILTKSNLFNSWTVRITIIAVLVALNAIMLFMISNSWEITRYFKEKEVNRHYNTYASEMKRLEEQNDCMNIIEYYNQHDLYYGDAFDEYRKVINISESYAYFYEYLMNCLLVDESEYKTKEEQAEFIAEQIDSIYESATPKEYDNMDCYKPEHTAYMSNIVNRTEILLRSYCGLSEEEIEQFPKLSNARRQIIIERGLGISD